MDRVGMELIGSHYAILLHDQQLRGTLTSDQEAQPENPEPARSEVFRQRAGSLRAAVRGTLAKFRLARIVRSPAD
jgi:hypothetical protein